VPRRGAFPHGTREPADEAGGRRKERPKKRKKNATRPRLSIAPWPKKRRRGEKKTKKKKGGGGGIRCKESVSDSNHLSVDTQKEGRRLPQEKKEEKGSRNNSSSAAS